MIRIQKVLQITFLFFFVYLVVSLKYEYGREYLPNIFFRADPLLFFVSVVGGGGYRVFLPALIVLFFTLFYGRFFCGWICPLGSIFDTVGSKKAGKNVEYIKFRNFKFYLLIFLFLIIFLNQQFIWMFDPISILSQGIIFILGKNIPILLVCVVVISVVFYRRAWCQFICPCGAILSLFSKIRIIKRKVNKYCNECRRCYTMCPVGAISPDGKKTIHSECISCLRCVFVCPNSAVKFDFINK